MPSLHVGRIWADGALLAPPPLALSVGVQSPYVHTLQHWLSLTSPRFYQQPCTGIVDTETIAAVERFAAHENIPTPSTIDIATWDLIEERIFATQHANIAERKPIDVKNLINPETAITALRGFGIYVNQDAASISQGWRLWQASTRKIDRFESVSFLGDITQLYPTLLNGAPPASQFVFDHFAQHWTKFYGAPWLGVQTSVPTFVDAADSLWCSSRLFQVLRQLGQHYFNKGLAKGIPIEVMLDNPITVLYTGKALGGLIAGRNDFSQIGMAAALELTPFHLEHFVLISEALANADPSYQLRIAKNDSLPKLANVHQQEEFLVTPVLEPAYEEVFYKPSSIKKHLAQQPTLLDRIPAERLAAGISDNSFFISSDEYTVLLKELKHIHFTTELDFIKAMRTYNGLEGMLTRFCEEEKSFFEAMLAINIRSFSVFGEELNLFYDRLLEAESKLLAIAQIKGNLSADLIRSGINVATAEASSFLKDQLLVALKEYVKHK